MRYELHGIAPAKSRVEVVGADGRTVARTVAGIDGNWNINDVDLCGGEHDLRAVSTDSTGHRVCSKLLCLDVEAEDLVPALTDEQREHVEHVYWQLIESRASGHQIESWYRDTACELLGKSIDDYYADVTALIEVNNELSDLGVDPRMVSWPAHQ